MSIVKKEGRSAFFVRLRFVEEIASKLFKRAEVAQMLPRNWPSREAEERSKLNPNFNSRIDSLKSL